MIIKTISIKKFRGFRNVQFNLGTHLTVIAGQNGTQKTTILGMLTQPFSIKTNDTHPMHNEKPLSGGSFKSAFSDKFRFSQEFDKPNDHEWTLDFFDTNTPSYTVESMLRDIQTAKIRFWKKGDRTKGSGYIQLPVIYLSLKRLIPIGEDGRLKENNAIVLSEPEKEFYQFWHNKILILTNDHERITASSYLTSTHKQTLGANTSYYDWKTNSAGQDNIGKILLAILTFKRLQKTYGSNYKGGILAIDEVDATFYSGSQIKLLQALIRFAADYKIQIIFTTHSLTILEEISKLKDKNYRKDQIKLMFLRKMDDKIQIDDDVSATFIKNHLNVTLTGKPYRNRLDVYTEDKECALLVKSLLGPKRTKHLNFINISLGCGNLIDLASRKTPPFTFPNSLIVLDGDVRTQSRQSNRVKKIKNILLLPTEKSPEQLVATFLNTLSASSPVWTNIDITFSHQYCFQDYQFEDIDRDRIKAKQWFRSHLILWGRNATKVLTPWKHENKDSVEKFIADFIKAYNNCAKKLELPKI